MSKACWLFILAGCVAISATAQVATVVRNGTIFQTFTASPNQIELFWLNTEGKPFRQFSSLQSALDKRAKNVRFMMNAGIFQEGGMPAGLVIIEGKSLRPLNTADGSGNFYLKPNGVFYVESGAARVVSTLEYAAQKSTPRIAIQSGPLLLRNGRTHPAFRPTSLYHLHRNGVGIKKDGTVLFAITEFGQQRFPNLYEFADFFRSQGCADALFLDGDLSQMVVDPRTAIPPGNHFGAIFAVTEPKK
ncbi:MAG: phosphodiester glycosidase family protein [Verrucomicrobia bacterium]|nr:phosphodiester glycosidase family protein [Verrucomicrobiota bacterium]